MKTRSPLVSIHRLKIKCPVCGRNDNCAVSDDRRIAFCRRVQSDHPGRGGWTHILGDDSHVGVKPQVVSQPAGEQTDRAPIEHRDAIYSTLIRKHLTLSYEHKQNLLARGMSEQEIARNGYVSTPDEHRASEIAADLSIYGLEGVPGFYKRDGEWRMAPTRSGYFVPHRDERGRIQGMQYRLDEPLGGGKTKYLWLSSRDCSSGAPVHFTYWHLLRDAREVTITEGALKADIAAFFLQSPVIGVAGVSSFGSRFAADLRRRAPRLQQVFIAYDRDLLDKPQVYDALMRLTSELERELFRVRIRTWPPPEKGYDDFLLSQFKRREVAA